MPAFCLDHLLFVFSEVSYDSSIIYMWHILCSIQRFIPNWNSWNKLRKSSTQFWWKQQSWKGGFW